MKFFTAATTALLAAESAFAARLTQKRWDNHAKRAITLDEPRRSSLLNRTQVNAETSTNWAGSVVKSTGLTYVTGTFTVPEASLPDDADDNTLYGAAAWVGIDGDTGTNSILQTGVDFLAEGGETSYEAWFEWYPAASETFSLDISAGDVITVTIEATTTKSGKATVENQSTGKSVTHHFSRESSALSEIYAEWILEDFEYGDDLIPFVDFDSVTFTDNVAKGTDGSFTPADGTLINIAQSGKTLAKSTVSGSKLTVTYV